MNKLVVVIIASPETHSKWTELSIAWARYGYQGEIMIYPEINEALVSLRQSDYQFCLLLQAGVIINEHWYLPHWEQQGFYVGINTLMTQTDFLLAGVVNDQQTQLSGECVLINLQEYRELPASSISSDQQQIIIYDQQIVVNFSQQLRHHYLNLQGSNDEQLLPLLGQKIQPSTVLSHLSADQQQFVTDAQAQINQAQQGVFLFNIESYLDIDQESIAGELDIVCGVAAGFKPYRILQRQGFHQKTKVIIFDYSEAALTVRRYLLEHWQGTDFPQFIRKLWQKFPEPEVFYQLWTGVNTQNVCWSDIEQLWQLELQQWGGEEQFAYYWQQYRQLPHEFIHCDLLNYPQPLFNSIQQGKKGYIWWSNAFFTIHSHWFYTAQERSHHYQNWLQALQKVAPAFRVNGADHNNSAVNGLTAKDYYEQFSQQQPDPLRPQSYHQTAIQF